MSIQPPAIVYPNEDISDDENKNVIELISYEDACKRKSFVIPKNLELPEDYPILYEKIRPLRNFDEGGNLLEKPPLEDIKKALYLKCKSKSTPDDEFDIMFKSNKEMFQIANFYGYHTTGYALFFKPDLGEVIKIAHEIIRKSRVCYLTTTPCDVEGKLTNHCPSCFNQKLYMHMAVTTIWYIE